MQKPYHVVFTTIFHPTVLNDLFENISSHNHLNETKIWIVGDRKTPESTRRLAQEISQKGLEIVYLDIEEQDIWGAQHLKFYELIPYDNETRRNIGYLYALEDGCRVLISIDDDNFPTQDDFIGGHMQTGSSWQEEILKEPGGFHNICEDLKFIPQRHIFPRGFPFNLRGGTNMPTSIHAPSGALIGATAGLWLSDPDVDATTWLNGKISGIAYTGKSTTVLAQSTWTPINTQNTSVARALIPAYLCVPMGWDVPGGKLQRYGDIWGGYFLQALMRGTKYHVAFGKPLVEHRRNPHNYIDDLRNEFWGMILTDWLVDMLRTQFNPKSTDMCDRVHELATFLEGEALKTLPSYAPEEIHAFMQYLGTTMHHWSDVCAKFPSSSA